MTGGSAEDDAEFGEDTRGFHEDDPRFDEDDPEFDETPPDPALTVAVAPAIVATLSCLLLVPAAIVGIVGTVVVAVGVRRARRRLHTVGAALCFLAVLLQAAAGGPPLLALVGGAGAVLAWDVGEHAIGLGQQVGSAAEARRGIVVHAGVSAITASGIVLVAGGVYLLARAGRTGPAAIVLAIAVGLFALLVER